MGRGGFKRNRGGRRRDNPRSSTGDGYHRTYPELVKENARLQQYYDGLLELEDKPEEREALWAAFRRDLPHSFRLCGSKGHALAVQKLLQTRYIPELAKMTHFDGLPVAPPQPVPWYPDGLAWWMTTSKTVIRKFPPFAAFQKFLVSETSVGNISRQEVVSMIPPLLLDVRPGMVVLDLCAAPGSKAAQLLEMLHQGEEARVRRVMQSMGEEGAPAAVAAAADEFPDDGDDGRATGVLIANDADYKRSQLLIHQLKRLSSPNMIVTNHDATVYPQLRLPPLPLPATPDNAHGTARPQPQRYLKFDRILADVPCSGDGTLRKNVTLWKDWNPANALGLHLVQVRILVRALQMLRPGGRVVYSTCSLNPVENESVVAAAIALCGGPSRVAIVDSSDRLPALQRRPGLKRWHIMDKSGRLWKSYADVEAYMRSDESGGVAPARVVPSMFPNDASDELPLERCFRIYPHLQDTGGFFIVALEKLAEFKVRTPQAPKPAAAAEATATDGAADRKRPADAADAQDGPPKKQKQDTPEVDVEMAEAEAAEVVADAADATAEVTGSGTTTAEAASETTTEATAKTTAETPDETTAEATNDTKAASTPNVTFRPKLAGPYEEPFKYLATDHVVVQEIREFYSLSSRFPLDRFMVRNAYGEPAKGIYYTSALVRDILVSNTSDGTAQQRRQQQQQQQQQVRVKFVHAGVRMFVKQEAPSAGVCRWRIQSEGMPLLQGYVGESRVVHLHSKETLRALLVEMFPKFADGGWKRLGEVGRRLPEIGMGCFVLKVEPGLGDETAETDNSPLEPMALPLWKSFQSLNLMLPKEDRAAMLLRIFNDTTPLVNNTLERNKKQHEPTAVAAAMATAAAATTTDKPDTANEEQNAYDAEDAPSE